MVEKKKKGMLMGKKVMGRLTRKYRITEKGTTTVTTLLKFTFHSGSTKICRCMDNYTSVRQTSLFKNNQNQLYQKVGGTLNMVQNQTPSARKVANFWSGIWSVEENHKQDASWLGEVKR